MRIQKDRVNIKFIFFILLGLCICGCSSTRYTYRQIEEDKDPFTSHIYQSSLPALQKAVVQVLLTKKFVIDHEDDTTGALTGSRYFSKGYQTIVVVVQSKILSKSDNTQQLWLNAIQTTERNYVADRTRFLLFIIPLPGGGGKEVTQSKESEFVINDKPFYNDLFNDIQQVVGSK